MAKRRFVNLLPAYLRTDDLKKFFSSTVDQLFQPGKADSLSGYIGRVPSYYDETKDFYIQEPSEERRAHQLEAVMVTSGETAIDRVLFYNDLVSNLRSQGAQTENQSRLFENRYYSWAPPIDLDKINNPQNYYWFGDDPFAQPGLLLITPTQSYVGDGSTDEFALPPVIAEWGSTESVAVFVDGIRVEDDDFSYDALKVALDVPPADGVVVEVYRYGDLKLVIEGRAQFNPVDLNTYGVEALVNSMRIVLDDAERRTPGWDSEMWDDTLWDNYVENNFIVSGVGSSIVLTPMTDVVSINALYVVIDALSPIQSPWSYYNKWIYKDAIAWSGLTYPDRRGRRPIIEFRSEVELYNYGRTRQGSIDAVLTTDHAVLASGWDNGEWDYVGLWDESDDIDIFSINGQPEGLVVVDNGVALYFGMRLLIAVDVEDHPELSHVIVEVTQTLDIFGHPVIALVPQAALSAGDMVTLPDGIEYVYNGSVWHETQKFIPGVPPLFALYDIEGDSLDDDGVYPESTFAGSRLFSYAAGTGDTDSVLNIPLKYDTFGQIVFENDLQTRRYAYRDGPVAGYYFYKALGDNPADDKFENDWHLVDTTSEQAPVVGDVYTIPLNLEANPTNEEVDFITRGQWFDHFASIMVGQEGFEGQPYSTNNWKDTDRVLNIGTKILQHRAPLLRTMLLSTERDFDYLTALSTMDHEYARFRNRFAQRAYDYLMQGSYPSGATVDESVLLVLESLKISKTSDFPFALSEMAGGQFFIPPTASSMGLLPVQVPLIIADDTYSPSRRFLRGHDGSRMPMFEQVIHAVSDGTTVDYIFENEPQSTITVLVNGSALSTSQFTSAGRVVTLNSPAAFGATLEIISSDVRDELLLGLEQRIFNNIPASMKTENAMLFELVTFLDGKFRDAGVNGYRRGEFVRIMTPFFLRWSQRNGLDFRANQTFDAGDAFTWNYGFSFDRDGVLLPGHWRAIYRWYFDTDRPHVAPWEMLGFPRRPSWWAAEYGAAPYASTNTHLWTDLRDGRIRQGPRAGVDARYIRPALLSYIPVDTAGALLDPIGSGIVPNAPSLDIAARPWKLGDHGPVENLWMNSTSYSFALCAAAYLLKPARWVEFAWDPTHRRMVHDSQIIYTVTGNRPPPSAYRVHGEADELGARQPLPGIQQWIAEAMIMRGQDPTILGAAVRALGVRLGHKVAGFMARNKLKVYADNFGLVPSEDVTVMLHNSPSVREEFYSGVVIEWTGAGWSVIGYDSVNPTFKIIPGDDAGPKVNINLSDTPEQVIVDWRPNIFYKADILVQYQNSVYRCTTAHTSTTTFEQKFWKAEPSISRVQGIRVYKHLDALDEEVVVPYGTQFITLQEVADFMYGYERWLESRGWIFDYQTEEGETVDWSMAVRQFMDWTQIQWEPGNFIALSPAAVGLKYHTDQGLVYSLEQAFAGTYGIVDSQGLPIDRRDVFVSRIDGEVSIDTRNDDLGGVRLNIGEIEHAMVFSNITIFNDIIYQPLFNLRQERLRVIGNRAPDWNGRMDAPGYIVMDGDITANFDGAAEDLRTMFDIEGDDHGEVRESARHLIAFETRDYLENLLLSDTQQFEFFQGMIHQKGAPGVFNKLLRSRFIEQERDLKFLEEWAIKDGTFGATNKLARVSFLFNQSAIQRNPQFVQFFPTTNAADAITLDETSFVEQPPADRLFFPRRSNLTPVAGDLPTAGPVRLTEVDKTVFRTSGIADLYDIKGAGGLATNDRVWVYEDEQSLEWNVLHVVDLTLDGTQNSIRRIEVSDAYDGARIYFNKPHGLPQGASNLMIVIDGETRTQVDLIGVQRIENVGADYIDIVADASEGYRWVEGDDDSVDVQALETADDPENSPVVRVLRPARFNSLEDANTAAATWMFPTGGELAYLTVPGVGWEVRSWNGANWNTVHREQPRRMDASGVSHALIYDQTTQITARQLMTEPLVLDKILILNPVVGLISGAAERELAYKLEYDPAVYVEIVGDEATRWGGNELGRLWWDLSTVRFLDAETDLPRVSDDARRISEIEYRVNNWAKIAPGTQVDVYEWVRSSFDPTEWDEEGEVYSTTSYVEEQEFDPKLNRLVTVYYYWVKNRVKIDRALVGKRKLEARTVARMIENPTALDIPWMAPVTPDGFVISGVGSYLNDSGTIFQVDIKLLPTENVVHEEWTLMRADDERSTPGNYLWDRLVDSVTGMNIDGLSVPDLTLHPSTRQGLSMKPRRSMFTSADARRSIIAARESFVTMMNRILARYNITQDRPILIESLDSQDTIGTHLFWGAETNEASDQISRLSADIDNVVSSLEERNALLLRPSFRAKKRRVYIDRHYSEIPQYSVWLYDPANDPHGSNDAARYANAENLFVLAPSYDYEAADYATMLNSVWDDGDLIYVPGSSATDDFWAVYRHESGLFNIVRAQRYRLNDFWDYTDWYADGYTAANPPIVTYQNIESRDEAQSPVPTSNFVKINDDGTGSWIWTVYQDGVWTKVARERGTISFSSKFYDDTRVVYGSVATTAPVFNMTDVVNRDGSYELRVIATILRDENFSDAEINELFFSMIHFAHSHSDQVTWAFKTSFMYIAGYNEKLIQTPVNSVDNTSNLIDYINEVKPYRVKVREFARTLTPEREDIEAHVTDFDKPLYYDAEINAFRVLDPNNQADADILANEQPWKDWYDHRNYTGRDPEDYHATTWNPVRRLKTKLLFDRIDGVYGLANGAATRISDYYEPTTGMPSGDLVKLLKLEFKGDIIHDGDVFANPEDPDVVLDGNSTTNAFTINATVDGVDTLGVLEPRLAAGRPEEMVRTDHGDYMYLSVMSNGQPGAPRQTVKFFDVSNEAGSTIDLRYLDLAQRNEGVGVFVDGMRLKQTDYTVNNFQRAIQVPLMNPWTNSPITEVAVHSVGPGGSTKIHEEAYFTYTSGPQVFPVESVGEVEVVVSGKERGGRLQNGVVTVDRSENYVRNPRGGLHGAGLPDYWTSIQPTGVTIEKIGSGSFDDEAYVDVRIHGTSSTTGVWSFDLDSLRAVANSTLTGRARLQVLSGALPGGVACGFQIVGFNGSNIASAVSSDITGTLATKTVTLSGAQTAALRVTSKATIPSATVIDCTIRVIGPSLTTPLILNTNDQVIIRIREPVSETVQMHVEQLAYVPGKSWDLTQRSTPWRPDEHALTIVEMNGFRLAPPATYYDSIGGVSNTIELNSAPASTSNIRIYVDNVQYMGVIETGAFTSVADVLAGGPYTGDWAIWDKTLVCVNGTLQSENVVVYVLENHQYTVVNGTLSVPLIAPGDILTATTFVDAAPMSGRTSVFTGSGTDYTLPVVRPLAAPYYWVTLNGRRQLASIHFNLTPTGIKYLYPLDSSDTLVVTIFPGDVAEIGGTYHGGSIISGRHILRPITDGDWDAGAWDDVEWDDGAVYQDGQSSLGARALFHMEDGWEYFPDVVGHRGYLAADLDITDASIVIDLPTNGQGVSFDNPFKVPQPDAPCVVWIEGERIEYSLLDRVNNVVTLSGLKRGTKGTRRGGATHRVNQYQGDGTTTVFELTGAITTANLLVTVFDEDGVGVTLSDVNYEAAVGGNGVEVTLYNAPDADESITLVQTLEVGIHKQGTKVVAATRVYSPDIYIGNTPLDNITEPWLFFF